MGTLQKCNKCGLIKSVSEFHTVLQNTSGLRYWCKQCHSKRHAHVRAPTYQMLNQIKLDAGGCENPDCQSGSDCTRLLSHQNNFWLFDLDHVDERLKLHLRETSAPWITHNWDEFMQRVKPNLQVLCTHCHRHRGRERIKLGGVAHGKAHGRKPPALFKDFGYNLFNQQMTYRLFDDDEDEVVAPIRVGLEDDWYVERDSSGNLIKYQDRLIEDEDRKWYDAEGEEV